MDIMYKLVGQTLTKWNQSKAELIELWRIVKAAQLVS